MGPSGKVAASKRDSAGFPGFVQEKEIPVLGNGSGRKQRLVAAAVLGSLVGFALSGCETIREVRQSGAVIAPAGHGPKVTFQNASTKPLEVRYWVGKRDASGVPGGREVMTPVAFQIQPGEQRMSDVGRPHWPTANTDAIVRVQVNLIDENGEHVEGVDPWWFEFERPSPYSIRAVNASRARQNLEFETWGEGNLFIVPADQWIPGHRGLYPVYDESE